VDVGLSFVVRFCVGSTSWCTRSFDYGSVFSQRALSAFVEFFSWRFLSKVPVLCYSAWESAVALSAMVAPRVSALGILGLCERLLTIGLSNLN